MRYLLFLFVLISSTTLAQNGINYQGAATDSDGAKLVDQNISLRTSVLQGGVEGTISYSETHNTTTDQFGLFNVVIGQGEVISGVFDDITWGEDAHFLKVELDATGGSDYNLVSTTQMMSVPYAKYAENAGLDSAAVADMLGNMNISNNNGGGCDFKFPDGLNGEPITFELNTENNYSYTAPYGKRLYITEVFTYGDGAMYVNDTIIMSLDNLHQNKFVIHNPYIISEGKTISTDSYNCNIYGILVDVSSNITPITYFNQNWYDPYIVPNNKKLVITNLYTENMAINIDDLQVRQGYGRDICLNAPIFLSVGQKISANGSGFHGYLVDEDYFENCGDVSGSSSIDSEEVVNSNNPSVSITDFSSSSNNYNLIHLPIDGMVNMDYNSISVDQNDNLYLLGRSFSSNSQNVSIANTTINIDGQKSFIVKCDSTGNILSSYVHSSSECVFEEVVINSIGEVFVLGSNNTLCNNQYDLGNASELIKLSDNLIFLNSIELVSSCSGNFYDGYWGSSFIAEHLRIDTNNNFYLAGVYRGDITLTNGTTLNSGITNNPGDILNGYAAEANFICKLSENGSINWVQTWTTDGSTSGYYCDFLDFDINFSGEFGLGILNINNQKKLIKIDFSGPTFTELNNTLDYVEEIEGISIFNFNAYLYGIHYNNTTNSLPQSIFFSNEGFISKFNLASNNLELTFLNGSNSSPPNSVIEINSEKVLCGFNSNNFILNNLEHVISPIKALTTKFDSSGNFLDFYHVNASPTLITGTPGGGGFRLLKGTNCAYMSLEIGGTIFNNNQIISSESNDILIMRISLD
tara:strand:+ start:2902 stop:5322 length:2421 start_codon:yes stop_codon:yes gene_type:complete